MVHGCRAHQRAFQGDVWRAGGLFSQPAPITLTWQLHQAVAMVRAVQIVVSKMQEAAVG